MRAPLFIGWQTAAYSPHTRRHLFAGIRFLARVVVKVAAATREFPLAHLWGGVGVRQRVIAVISRSDRNRRDFGLRMPCWTGCRVRCQVPGGRFGCDIASSDLWIASVSFDGRVCRPTHKASQQLK